MNKTDPSARLPKPVLIRSAKVIPGRGRGKIMGIPTINLEPEAAPPTLKPGIYAAHATIAGKTYMGALHYGPRPAFRDTRSLEVHIIDGTPPENLESLDLEIIGWIREIADFPSIDALIKCIQEDIEIARGMLSGA